VNLHLLKDRYLEVTNLDFLGYFLQHKRKSEIKAISLYCFGHLKESIEIFANSMEKLSISKLYLRFTNIDDETFQRIIHNPSFQKIQKLGLSFNEEITDSTITTIADLSTSSKLKCLEIDSTSVTDEGVRTMTSSLNFENIKELDLSELHITKQSIQYLCHPLTFFKLKSLKLTGYDIDFSDLLLISESPKFSCLKSLKVNQMETIEIDVLKKFCKIRPYNLNLVELTLKCCDLTANHMKLICQSETLSQLKSLDLTGNNLDDQITSDFIRAKFQNTLRSLILAKTQISDKFIKKLTQTKCYSKLDILSLAYCPEIKSVKYLSKPKHTPFSSIYFGLLKGTPRDFAKILETNFLHLIKFKLNAILSVADWNLVFFGLKGSSKLKVIKFSNLRIEADAIKKIFTQVEFPLLERFKLAGNPIFTKETMDAICYSQTFPKLSCLSLKNNSLGDKEIESLMETSNFPFLDVLDLYYNLNLSEASIQKVLENQHFPLLEVVIYGNGKLCLKHK